MANFLLDALGYLGESIDKPGAAVRGLLSGRPDQLANLIPFSDAMGITDPSQRVSGRGLLENLGMMSPKEEGSGFDLGDLAGMGADLATNPLTYLGPAGAIKGVRGLLGRGGTAAKEAESLMAGQLNKLGAASEAEAAAPLSKAASMGESAPSPRPVPRYTPPAIDAGLKPSISPGPAAPEYQPAMALTPRSAAGDIRTGLGQIEPVLPDTGPSVYNPDAVKSRLAQALSRSSNDKQRMLEMEQILGRPGIAQQYANPAEMPLAMRLQAEAEGTFGPWKANPEELDIATKSMMRRTGRLDRKMARLSQDNPITEQWAEAHGRTNNINQVLRDALENRNVATPGELEGLTGLAADRTRAINQPWMYRDATASRMQLLNPGRVEQEPGLIQRLEGLAAESADRRAAASAAREAANALPDAAWNQAQHPDAIGLRNQLARAVGEPRARELWAQEGFRPGQVPGQFEIDRLIREEAGQGHWAPVNPAQAAWDQALSQPAVQRAYGELAVEIGQEAARNVLQTRFLPQQRVPSAREIADIVDQMRGGR